MAQIEILDPIAEDTVAPTKLSPRLSDLKGKVVGLRIQWDSFDVFCRKLEELLREEYGIGGAVRIELSGSTKGAMMRGVRAGRPEQVSEAIDEFAKKVDGAIVGLAA